MTDEDAKPDFIFWTSAKSCIEMMATHGLTDTQIACVLHSIRAAAINEERFRVQNLLNDNPPKLGITWVVMCEELQKYYSDTLKESRNG